MTAPEMVGLAASTIAENAKRLGLVWTMRPATVVSYDRTTGMATAIFDGDTVPLTMTSLAGPLTAAQRVMVMIVPPSGNFIIGSVGNVGATDYKLIAFGERVTASTAAAGAQGVLRLDNIPVVSGRSYLIQSSNMLLFSTSGATDRGSVRFAFSTSGAATTGSSLMAIWNSDIIQTISDGVGCYLSTHYTATTTGFLSVLIYTLRLGGSGNISIFGNAIQPTQLMAFELNGAVPNTGVSI
jgi:hypothetical protein